MRHLILVFLLSSCSLLSQNDERRTLQTKILSKLAKNAPKFSECAQNTDVFKDQNAQRLRVVMHLSLSNKGSVESFKLDRSDYSTEFSECLFNVIDLMTFPKNKLGQIIEVEQPFIFSKQ